jgi:hypothetical protein
VIGAACTLALALCANPVPRPTDVLASATAQGSAVEKSFTLEHLLVAQKVELAGASGNPLMQKGLEVASKIELSVVDTATKVEAGKVLGFRRLYQGCGMHIDLETTDSQGAKTNDKADADTPLKGHTVVFTWVPEEKDYGRYYDGIETLEEYLAKLTEDLDLRCLLPGPEIHQGGTWTIDPARLVGVFVAGGEIPLGFVSGGGGRFARVLMSGVGGPLHEVFGGSVKGAVTAKWTETREATLESRGARLAVVQLTVTIETEHEHGDAQEPPSSGEEPADAQKVKQSGVKWKFDGSGTLLWNLDAQRFETLDLVGHEEVTSDVTLEAGTDSTRQVLTMAGSLKVGARAGAARK